MKDKGNIAFTKTKNKKKFSKQANCNMKPWIELKIINLDKIYQLEHPT